MRRIGRDVVIADVEVGEEAHQEELRKSVYIHFSKGDKLTGMQKRRIG